jgi:uncharacterized protein
MMSAPSVISPILDQLRQRLERVYGPRLAGLWLYGSRARGDAAPDSDIDVLVVLEGEVAASDEIARTEYDVADVSLEHNAVVACLFVSRERFEHGQSPLLLNVRREGIAV